MNQAFGLEGSRLCYAVDRPVSREFCCFLSDALHLQSTVVTTNLSWPSPPGDWSNTLGSCLENTDGARAVPARSAPSPAVHIWAASLAVPSATLDSLKPFLSKQELDRAARFHFEHHRSRFIAGRGLLRRVLGRYLETDPAALEFVYGPNGKPAVAGSAHASKIEFNLAHSEDLALLAVTQQSPVGVDVEALRHLTDAADLVARFFCPRENQIFSHLAVAEQPAAFFNLWTRKEALLKATGEGIGRLLNQVEVSFLPDEQAKFRHLPTEVASPADWTLRALSPAPGYTGALATTVKSINLQCWKWEWLDPSSR
jgi:4'-phosphopantetheinyl transferase